MALIRNTLASALCLAALATPALAQSGGSGAAAEPSSLCKPDTRIEILSEGAWYPGVVLDALRDGRCFVHYDGYGADDDEAVAPKLIRSAR